MQIARIKGKVISTQKNEQLHNEKLVVIEPLDLDLQPMNKEYIALDAVDAGKNDYVIFIKEGGGAAMVKNKKKVVYQCVIVGVIDEAYVKGVKII